MSSSLLLQQCPDARSRRYLARTVSDADYADDIPLLPNTPAQVESLLHSLGKAAGGIGLQVNTGKTKYMCINQNKKGDIPTLKGGSLKLIDKFIYLRSSISSTENDLNTRLAKAWTAIDRLSVIWRSDLSVKIRRNSLLPAVMSILLYGCTPWTLTKRIVKKLDGSCTRILRAAQNKSWKQHHTKQQLYGHPTLISKIIQVRQTHTHTHTHTHTYILHGGVYDPGFHALHIHQTGWKVFIKDLLICLIFCFSDVGRRILCV